MNEVVRGLSPSVAARPGEERVSAGWDHHRLAIAIVMALSPALAVSFWQRPGELAAAVALAAFVAFGWIFAFARLRRRRLAWDWVATALIFAILVPSTATHWQQALALSFGVVMGDQIFGGRGRNFLHPATVALAFLLFSFPVGAMAEPNLALAVAASLGGALLLAWRIASWRVVVALVLGAAVGLLPGVEGADWNRLLTGVTIAAAIFLIADPVAAASTNPGRWAYGFLAGLLVVVFGQAGGDPGSLRAVVFAALLSGIFAPTIDQMVMWLNARRRRRRG